MPPLKAKRENGVTAVLCGLVASEVTLAEDEDSTGCWAATGIAGENVAAGMASRKSVRQEVKVFKIPPIAKCAKPVDESGNPLSKVSRRQPALLLSRFDQSLR